MFKYFLIGLLLFPIQIIGQDTINMSDSKDTLNSNLNPNITTTSTTSNDSLISLYDEQIDEIKILL